MFIIKELNSNEYTMKKHIKVIIFETFEEATAFIQAFQNYSMGVAMCSVHQWGFDFIELVQNAQYQIISLPNNFEKPIIDFKNLKND